MAYLMDEYNRPLSIPEGGLLCGPRRNLRIKLVSGTQRRVYVLEPLGANIPVLVNEQVPAQWPCTLNHGDRFSVDGQSWRFMRGRPAEIQSYGELCEKASRNRPELDFLLQITLIMTRPQVDYQFLLWKICNQVGAGSGQLSLATAEIHVVYNWLPQRKVPHELVLKSDLVVMPLQTQLHENLGFIALYQEEARFDQAAWELIGLAASQVAACLTLRLRSAEEAAPINATLEQVEREHISRVLQAMSGNRSHAAQILGISRATLIKKIERYGLDTVGRK